MHGGMMMSWRRAKGLGSCKAGSRIFAVGTLVAMVGMLASSLMSAPLASAAGGVAAPNTPYGAWTQLGKSHLVQDPQWLTNKQTLATQRYNAYLASSASRLAGMSPNVVPNGGGGAPSAYSLGGTTVVGNTLEPLGGGGTDANGTSYTDLYMWGLCGEGATTNALWYWGKPINNFGTGKRSYTDPHITTTWDNGNNRSYLMWLATTVRPPSFISNGEATYGAYPSINTAATDIRDTLNWEASGENSGTWANYYYGVVLAASITQSGLNADIMSDVGVDHRPDVVGLNALYLPNWQGHAPGVVSHYVTIIGYNNTTSTYTYVDSCGKQCGAPGGAGVFNVSQATLYTAIQNNNGNGSLVW